MYRPPNWLRLTLLAAIVCGIVVAVLVEMNSDAARIHEVLRDFGPLVPVAYVAAHILASLFFVPRSVMALVAAMLFGFWEAVFWATVGSMAGAVTGFLFARYINAGLVVPEEIKRIGPVLKRAEEGGWRAVAIVRLMPFLPHALTNYALGLTRLGVVEYTIGSFIGILPEAYVFVELGISGTQALRGGSWIEPALWVLAFIALSIILPRFLRRADR